jgi:chromate transporter
VVAFVAYLGGASAGVVSGSPALSGIVAALVVAFFTFLPSFVFILVGAPFVESTRGNLRLTGPLTAISAAVVGVIASLATVFAWHVWLPTGEQPFGLMVALWGVDNIDVLALSISAASAWALFRAKVNVLWVILASAAFGAAIGASIGTARGI